MEGPNAAGCSRSFLLHPRWQRQIQAARASRERSAASQGPTVEPSGFIKDGFAHAETVYAGSEGTPSAANGSVHAVSQYDVACYQVTSNQ